MPSVDDWETSNLHTVGSVLAHVAAIRMETRGGHWREDYPERDDRDWLGHVTAVTDEDGMVRAAFHRKERT